MPPEVLFTSGIIVNKNTSNKVLIEQSVRGIYLVDSQENNTNWELWAESTLTTSVNSNWRFNQVRVFFYSKEKDKYKVTSDIASLDLKNQKMSFEGNIVIEAPNGYLMKATSLSYNFLDKFIFSNEPVEVKTTGQSLQKPISFTASQMEVFIENSKINLQGIKSEKTLDNNKKVFVESHFAFLSGLNYFIEYKDKVHLKGMGIDLKSQFLKMIVNPLNRTLKKVIAKKNVRVQQGVRRGYSQKTVMDIKTEVVTMTENPRLQQGSDVLYGDKIIFYNKTQGVAIRRARAKVDRDSLETYNEPTKGR